MFIELRDRKGETVFVNVNEISHVRYTQDDYKNLVAKIEMANNDVIFLSCKHEIKKLLKSGIK